MNYQSNGADASPQSHDSFYRKRRNYIDEVVFDTSLKPLTRLVGVAIAQHCNRESGDTYIDATTLALRLGERRNVCLKAI